MNRFLFPYKGCILRPETFVMASLMAHGRKVSLAPTVTGFIYRRHGEISKCPRGPSSAGLAFPIHYLIGWMGQHFSELYDGRQIKDFPECYPLLARY